MYQVCGVFSISSLHILPQTQGLVPSSYYGLAMQVLMSFGETKVGLPEIKKGNNIAVCTPSFSPFCMAGSQSWPDPMLFGAFGVAADREVSGFSTSHSRVTDLKVCSSSCPQPWTAPDKEHAAGLWRQLFSKMFAVPIDPQNLHMSPVISVLGRQRKKDHWPASLAK